MSESWFEAVFIAKLRSTRLERDAHGWSDRIHSDFVTAWSIDPRRAEPLVDIATHFYAVGDHASAYLYARAATQLPMPDALLVESEVYTFTRYDLLGMSAYHLSKQTGDEAVREIGRRAAQAALAVRPQDSRLQACMKLYKD